jgi:hypothetical protein
MIVNEELETLEEEAVLASETLLAYFPSFEKTTKTKGGLWKHPAVCVSPNS